MTLPRSPAHARTNEIAYFRVRIASEEFDLAGRKCVGVEPVTKGGLTVDSPWVFCIPTEWLIPLDEMRKAVRK